MTIYEHRHVNFAHLEIEWTTFRKGLILINTRPKRAFANIGWEMTTEIQPAQAPSLVERVKNILLTPKTEWDRINGEPSTTQGLYTGYVMVLAAIGPICAGIGAILFGWGAFGISIHPPVMSVVVSSIVSYILALASVFVMSLIIDALATTFGGEKNPAQALKVAVYSSTAAWVAGVFGILPMLAPLGIVGLYSLYLLYLGLPRLMKAPEDKALPYTAVVILAAIVLAIVVGAVIAPLRMMGMGGAGLSHMGSGGTVSGTVNVGGASVDLGKLQAATEQMKAQAEAAKAGGPAATGIAPDVLKGLLPASLNGYTRGDVSAESSSAAGVGASHAQAEYTKGDGRITLEITDMAAMGGLGAMASALNVNSSKETSTGYEKVATINGHMTTEEYDRSSKSGKFGVMAGGHVMVEARGEGVPMDDLKAAVAAVGPDKLDALTKH